MDTLRSRLLARPRGSLFSMASVPRLLRFVDHVANLRVHLDIVPATLRDDTSGLPVVAAHRQLRLMLEVIGPSAEIVAEPWRLRLELGEFQLVLPNGTRALHVRALGKRQRRIILTQRRIDEQRRIFRATHLVAGSVA